MLKRISKIIWLTLQHKPSIDKSSIDEIVISYCNTILPISTNLIYFFENHLFGDNSIVYNLTLNLNYEEYETKIKSDLKVLNVLNLIHKNIVLEAHSLSNLEKLLKFSNVI